MIIHYIQLRTISKKLKLFSRTLNSYKCVFFRTIWFQVRENATCLIIKKDIANESIELGNKTLHTEDKWKVLGIMC